MENKFLVSFGDSDKYLVDFPGNLSMFENSDVLKNIKDKVASFVKEKFPMGGFGDLLKVHVEEYDGKGNYNKLDLSKLSDLLQSVASQVNVMRGVDKLNLNAPFDKL